MVIDNAARRKFSRSCASRVMLRFQRFAEWGAASMTTMLYQRVRDLAIVTHSAEDPSAAEWSAYTRYLHVAQRSDRPLTGILVTTLGGSPNAKQRAAVLEAITPHPVVTCVCTNSVLARGVLTAMSWLGKHPMHAFRLLEIDRALSILGAPPDLQGEAMGVLARLQAQLTKAA
jgi:hypothetical protein